MTTPNPELGHLQGLRR